jgi:hypothetical protein
MRVLRALAAGLIMLAIAATAALPQDKAPAAAANAKAQQIVVPPPEVLIILVRSTIIALHHANITGNYTVLRDLAAPGFQAANSPAQLGQIFANLRSQRIDLAPVVLVTPELVQTPAIGDDGMLKLVGVIPLQPQRIAFQLAFQPVNGFWRPFGIAINPIADDKDKPAERPATGAPAASASSPAAKAGASNKQK